jgi:cyclohexadienyl dehydratase
VSARAAITAALALWLAAPAAPAQPALRVGTSGDYPPFSLRAGADFEGFDVALARAYARERGLALELVPFHWPELVADLAGGRFDVAMGGVTVRPERSLAGTFTVPVVESGAVALVRKDSGFFDLASLNDPGVRIAVNAGGHLESVARASFHRAKLSALPDNAAVLPALRAGEVDAAVTDTIEARVWRRDEPGLVALGPFTRDLKAYLAGPGAAARAADLSDWLLAREADGRLAAWREEWLGAPSSAAVATPLEALLAGVDERLSLMPLVAEAKRARGLAVVDPAREEAVVKAALRASAAAAAQAGRAAVDPAAVEALFRAQIAAGRAIQEATLREARAGGDPAPDLDALRAALGRIGERIARLATRLPDEVSRDAVARAAARRLVAPRLGDAGRARLVDAIVALVEAPRG